MPSCQCDQDPHVTSCLMTALRSYQIVMNAATTNEMVANQEVALS